MSEKIRVGRGGLIDWEDAGWPVHGDWAEGGR